MFKMPTKSLRDMLAAKKRGTKRGQAPKIATAPKTPPVAAAAVKKAPASKKDAQDSDTVSDDSHSRERAKVYQKSLHEARSDLPCLKRARDAGLLKHPSSLHSDVLDAPPVDATVSVDSFDFKREAKAPEVATTMLVDNGADDDNVAAAAAAPAKGEPLAEVAVHAKNGLGVAPGKAEAELAKRSILAFEQEKGRPAEWTDAKDIKAGMQVQRKADEKASRKRKWTGRLSDADAVRIAGADVAHDAEAVRARIEARTHDERRVREAALQREKAAAATTQVDYVKVRDDADPRVPVSEVKTSGTGRTQSAHSTTPAPGTEQRDAIERELGELDDMGVVVSPHARAAKLATSVPPALPVQGRRLDPPEAATGALIHGNGATVQSPLDYALEALVNKSTSTETRVQDALEQMYHMLLTATKRFYDAYSVVPEDSEFKRNPKQYATLFKNALHERIDAWCKPGTKRSRLLRSFLAERFVGDTADDRCRKLREKLEKQPPSVDERDALVDAVLVGGVKDAVAADEDDVHDAAKRASVKWQVDAEVEALMRAIPDISDAEIAEQQAGNVRPEEHVLLSRLREHARNDALYRTTDDAPITLMRQNETIFGPAAGADGTNTSTTGHERHVTAEARRLYYSELVPSKHVDMLRSETTRMLRASRSELDELMERSHLCPLSQAELERCQVLRRAIEDAEEAAKDAHNRAIIEHYGHPDAAAAYKNACDSVAVQLEERTRADLDNYLREPYGDDERPCANDLTCIGREMDENGKTTLRELLSLEEEARFLTDGTLPKERRFCYLCEMYQVTNEFMKLKDQKNSGGVRLIVLQRFKTIFDRPGEYSSETCNLAAVLNHRAYGIVAPFPAFDRANYKYALREVKVAKNTTVRSLADERSGDESARAHEFEVHTVRGFVEMPSMLFREASDATTI